jgi:hypothetical protein
MYMNGHWSKESQETAGIHAPRWSPAMYEDLQKAIALKNLSTFRENGQLHATDDVEAARKQLEKDSILSGLQKAVAELQKGHEDLKKEHYEHQNSS